MAAKGTLHDPRLGRGGAGRVGLAATLIATGLLLPAPGGGALAQSADRTPSAQQLIDRLRQIQGEIRSEQPAAARSAQGLAERVRQIRSEMGETQAAPELSEEEVRSRLQDEFGVEIIGIDVVEVEGRPAYAVKVMNPPGNYNAAFLVSTLLVDGETGEVLGQAPGRPMSADPRVLPETFRPEINASGLEIRRRTYR